MIKRFFLAVFFFLPVFAIVSAHGQVVPAATAKSFSLNVGAFGSAFQPDYAGFGEPYISPYRLYGPGAYVDAHFTRWIQIEAEGRWLRFNEYYPYPGSPPIDENTYLIGPRVPIVENFHRITPYGKFLFGWSSAAWLDGRAPVLSYGAGVDYRLSRKFTLRAFDFEYQQWRVAPTLWPYGGSIGISYKIF